MKLRIRLSKFRSDIVVIIDSDNVTKISDLKNVLINDVPELSTSDGVAKEFRVSLNGCDPLDSENDSLLDELGLIDGDLLYILRAETDVSFPDTLFIDPMPVRSAGTSRSLTGNPTTDNTSGVSDHTVGTVQTERSMDIDDESTSREMTEILVRLNEPILIRDSSDEVISPVLMRMYLEGDVKTKSEAICLVLNALVMECGFNITVKGGEGSIRQSGSADLTLPHDWRTPSAYLFSYTHKTYDTVSCDLTCVPIGHSMMAHACCNGCDMHSLQVNTNEFVHDITPDGIGVYKKLSKLSRLFMDNIGLPLQQDLSALLGLPHTVGFMALPHEIKLQILGCVDVASLLRLSEVCRDLRVIASDPYLWRRLHLIMFGARRNNDLCQDWKQLFIEEFKRRPSHDRVPLYPRFLHRDQSVLWPYRPIPLFPRPPGILGGDYDMRPLFDFSGFNFPRRDITGPDRSPLRFLNPDRPPQNVISRTSQRSHQDFRLDTVMPRFL